MHSDFRELLAALGASAVKYLVVGGYAVMEYTEPRYTKDLDLWVARDRSNAEALYRALAAFGAPLHTVTVEDFTQPGIAYRIGISPVRIDVLTSITGVDFEEAWSRRVEGNVEGLRVPIISREDLIANKSATGRLQDRLDARRLTAAPQRPKHSRRRRGQHG